MKLALPHGHMGPLEEQGCSSIFFFFSGINPQPTQALESDFLGLNRCDLEQAI